MASRSTLKANKQLQSSKGCLLAHHGKYKTNHTFFAFVCCSLVPPTTVSAHGRLPGCTGGINGAELWSLLMACSHAMPRSAFRVNSSQWNTKENRQHDQIFCICLAHGKMCLKLPEMGQGVLLFKLISTLPTFWAEGICILIFLMILLFGGFQISRFKAVSWHGGLRAKEGAF